MPKQAISLTNSRQYLASLGKDCFPLSTKIAIITYNQKPYSYCFYLAILLFEYLQMMSQVLLLLPDLYRNDILNENFAIAAVISAAKLMNPGSWIDLSNEKTFSVIMLSAFGIFIICKYFLLLYVTIIAKLNAKGLNFLIILWRLVFELQPRVMCFFITSIFFKSIFETSQDGLDNFRIGRMSFIIACIVMIALEYALSFFIQTVFCFMIPSKSFLACKNNSIEIMNLVQKLMFQIFGVALVPKLSSTNWIFALSNILFAIIREGYFYSTLPLYNLKAISYQATLSMILTSLNLSYFAEIIFESLGYETGVSFVLVTWVILSILMVKMSNGYLKAIMLNLTAKSNLSSLFLLNKISVIKFLRKKKRLPSYMNQKHQLPYLLDAAVNSCIRTIFHFTPSASQDIQSGVHSKESLNKIFLAYLDSLMTKFPKNDFIKLYYAYICIHKLQHFSAAIKIISNIKQSFSKKVTINASLLMYQMQNKIATQSKDENNSIDLTEYIESLSQVHELKTKMTQQAQAQSKTLQEVLSDTPDLQNIFNKSQIVDDYVTKIKKRIKKAIEFIPDAYIEPLLLFAYYSLILNHSTTDYIKYCKKYTQRYKKYDKALKSDKLIKENLFQDTNVFIMFSGQKADAGKILYCSGSIQKLSGNPASSCIGTNIASIFPPSVQSFYTSYFRTLSEKGDKSLLRKVIKSFSYHREGYIRQVEYYIDFHPHVTEDFCFNMIVRPFPTVKDYLILLENGDIECATEKIAKKLGLLVSQGSSVDPVNIKQISEDLSLVNHAFNVITLSENSRVSKGGPRLQTKGRFNGNEAFRHMKSDKPSGYHLNKGKVEELYSIYTTKGANLKLKSLEKSLESKIFSYHCTVTHESYGSVLIKVITLDENTNHDDDNENQPQEIEKNLPSISYRLNTNEKIREKDIAGKISLENIEVKTNLEIDKSEDLTPPDEKLNGWFNFQTLENKKPYKRLNTSNGQENNQTNGVDNFESTEEQILSLDQKTTVPGRASLFNQVNRISKAQVTTEKVSKSSKRLPSKEFHNEKSFRAEGSLAASQISKISLQKKISKAFKAALAIKHSPKSLKIICMVFYILLIAIFATQTQLKGTLDESVEFVKTSKEIVYNAELRNFLLVSIQQTSRIIFDLHTKMLVLDQSLTPQYFAFLLNFHLTNLRSTNGDLFTSMDSLDEETRRILFMKDVKMYDNYYDEPDQTFSNLNNFQATSRLIQVGLKSFTLILRNRIKNQKEIRFLLRNTVNDLLIKNEMTSNLLMVSLNSKQSDISNTVNFYLWGSVCLLGIWALAFIWIAWSQFNLEKFNMIALIRLNEQQTRKTLDKIIEFKTILEKEQSFEDNLILGTRAASKRSHHAKLPQKSQKRESLKVPNISGIVRRYCFNVLRLLLMVGSLASLITWYSVSNNDSLRAFQKKQSEFFFINRLKSQLSLAATMPQELFSGNGTTMTHNQLNPIEFSKTIDNLREMKNNLVKILMNEEGVYDPQIEDILFRDGCQYLASYWSLSCQSLKNNGKNTGLVYFLSDLQTLLEETRENFKSSNKTKEALMALNAQSFSSLTFPYLITAAECDAISSLIGQILEVDILGMLGTRTLMYGFFVSIFVVLSILVWVIGIRPLNETSNRFKKVLQVFPADLVLSSFLLKSFLLKTSSDTLNSVKNDL